jgi:hypothetical protein
VLAGPLLPVTVLLAAAVGCLVVPRLVLFVVAPARMRARSSQAIDPVYEPDDEDQLPAAARRAADGLRSQGFADRGTWRHHGAARAVAWVILLEHPRARDVARVIVVETRRKRTVTVAFQTQFGDGTEAITANNRLTAGFPQPPGITSAWLPEVADPVALYRIHAQLCDAVGGAGGRVGIGADPVAFLKANSVRSLTAWVAAGYYVLDEARGVVRPTWKGAAMVTWRLIWPIRPLYRARRRWATRRLLDRLGISEDE